MSNELRAALRTAVQSAVAVVLAFLVAATGWINNENADLADDIDTAWKALVVIGVGVLGAVVTFVGTKVQDKLGLGKTPVYTPAKESGGGDE